MKINTELLRKGTCVMHDGKPIHLQSYETMDYAGYIGDLKIVLNKEVVCDTQFCYNIYCDNFGEPFAEMKLTRLINMYLYGHPLLDVPFTKTKTPYDDHPEYRHDYHYVWEKFQSPENYVRADFLRYLF